MKVLVTGGREFADSKMMFKVIEHIDIDIGEITEIIHGDARGADRMAADLGRALKVQVSAFPADWTRYRAQAGPIRNSQMLTEGRPDLVVAFPGGSGTRDMVNKARAAGVRVIRAEQAYKWILAHENDDVGDISVPDRFTC